MGTSADKSAPMPIRLGDRVRDIVTGIEGVATSRTEWLNGCVRFGIEFATGKNGDQQLRRESFDEEQLELVKARAVQAIRQRWPAPATLTNIPVRSGGGGRPDPRRQGE